MSGLPIPPNTEPLSTGDRPNDIWWRFWEADSKALNALTTVVSALPISTASTFSQTILATTTSSQVRTILGVDAADTVGSWTPQLAVGGTTIGTAPSVASGRYVKTASGQVSAWGTITITTRGATTGDLTIAGLPFTATTTAAGLKFSGSVGHVSGIGTLSSLSGVFTCYVSTGASAITMAHYSTFSGASVNVGSTQLTTAASISVSVSYETTL